jgi:thiosulfate reductase cytochrome b subunit
MTGEVTMEVRALVPAGLRDVQFHPLSRRIMHWINAFAIIVMIGSGWRIYNYYPALPIDFGFPNYLTLGGDFTVTEAVNDEDGLANALAWHFAAMWVLVINFFAFVIVGFVSGHFRRDFLPVGPRAFIHDLWAAMRFKLDHRLGEYNAVQKVLYWGVLGAILVAILSGLGIWKPVQLQELTWLFGGYEFARVVHFFGMATIVSFIFVHVALTFLVPKTFVAMIVGRASSTPRAARETSDDATRP